MPRWLVVGVSQRMAAPAEGLGMDAFFETPNEGVRMSENGIDSSMGPKCPYCGHIHTRLADQQAVVSYWGDYSIEFGCHNCAMAFEVKEVVKRYWTSAPIVQEAAKKDE